MRTTRWSVSSRGQTTIRNSASGNFALASPRIASQSGGLRADVGGSALQNFGFQENLVCRVATSLFQVADHLRPFQPVADIKNRSA
jgi:hypothetical protein